MAKLKRNRRPVRRDRRGAIFVLVVLILPVLCVIVGFSVDLALMQSVRTEMRAAADLSAKAAVGELSRSQNMNKARQAARNVASSNLVAGATLTLDDEDIVFGRSERQSDGTWTFQANSNPINSVKVDARRTGDSPNGPVGLYFGRFYGHTSFEQEMSATASFLDIDICLVLDRSSSMKLSTDDMDGLMSTSSPRFCSPPWSDSRWVALENAVSLFISRLSTTLAKEHVALVTFGSNYTSSCGETNSEATTDQNLDDDLSLINQAMSDRSSTVWNGATNIDAGISQARSVLTGNQSRDYATKIMIVLTDGVYTGGNPVPEATTSANAGIVIHTITFGDGANQSDMQAVAQAGDGEHYHAPDTTSLNDVFTQISGSIAILTE